MNDAMNAKKDGSSVVWPLFLLFFTSVDTVLFGTNSNKSFLFVPRIVALLIIIMLPVLKKQDSQKRSLSGNGILVFFCFMLLFSVSSLVNHEALETSLSRALTMVSAFVIVSCYTDEEYFSALEKFIFIVAVFAFITEFIAYVVPTFFRYFPRIRNTKNVRFFVYFFGGLEEYSIYKDLIRASGIFWEPGAFSIYLITGISYQLFGRKKINFFHLIVFIIALIITFSTTGYLAFALILLGFTFSRRTDRLSKRIKGLLVSGTLVIVLLSIVFESTTIQEFVFNKLFSGTSSATTRYSSIFNGMKVALSHPAFGVGNDYRDYMVEFVETSIFNNGGTSITNTVVAQFACYGLPFGFLFLFGTLAFFKRWSQNTYDWIVLCLTMMLAYAGERFFSFFPFVFVFYGFCDPKRYRKYMPLSDT